MAEDQIDFNDNEQQADRKGTVDVKLNSNNSELTWGNFLLFFLTYFLVSLGVGFVASLILIMIELVSGVNLYDAIEQIQYVSLLELGAFLITILIFKKVRHFLKGRFDFSVLKEWQTYLYLIGAYVVVYAAQTLFFDVLEWEVAGSQIELFGLDTIDLNALNIMLLVFAFVVIAPITEEVLFRGVLFGFLNKKLGMITAILINLIIFGLLHPGHQFSTAIMALVFILLYTKTKSLIVPILFHMIWNALATYTLLSLVMAG